MSIAVVAGALANKPLNGGFAWVPLSYALGLRQLGFDVYLLEQLGDSACVDAAGRSVRAEDSINRAFFLEVVRDFGFAGRAALIHDDGSVTGMDAETMRRIAGEAELLFNISGNATLDWMVNGPRLTAFIDTDPGFTQIWNRERLLHPSVGSHDFHFTVGSNLGRNGCLVPHDGIRWRPSPPPVVLDQWPVAEHRPGPVRFTTVATWRCPSGPVSLDGATPLPSKLHEFRKVLTLPSLVGESSFELALDIHSSDVADRENLQRSGWTLVDPRVVAGDPASFREYVGASSAEFSTVQGVYAVARTGWISDRSVRYLASGRPVLVQDTAVAAAGLGREGLLTFSTLTEARHQAERIAADYSAHSAAARHLAETAFASDLVLGEMLNQMAARR